MESTTPLITPDDHSAGRRAREVYRFFRPERLAPIDGDASYSRKADLDLPGSPHSNISQSSHCSTPSTLNSMIIGDSSSTLNSFAQLAALRLDVDRVFISVSDRDSQFILAQAAQTAGDTKYDSLCDGLYSGPSTLDTKTWIMCKDTVALPPSTRTKGNQNFIISNDLSQDDRYKHLPLVQKDPKFRFYAGTPITTDSNINLGCFFALDTKPHAEFTNIEKETMGQIAILIMEFLKISRQASEGRRASRLSLGLNYFVEGNARFSDACQSPGLANPASEPFNERSVSSPARKARSQTRDHLSISNASPKRSRSRGNSTHSFKSASDVSGEASVSSSYEVAYQNEWDRIRTGDAKGTKGNSWTFRRAANLIRESLELQGDDGVVFVEAGRDDVSNSGSDSDISSSSSYTDNSKPVSVLAISTEENSFDQEKTSISSAMQNMDEEFMRHLLRRYNKKGNIWSFHRDGMLSSSEGEDLPRRRRARARPASLRSKTQKWKLRENLTLNACFPGTTQVLFVPLWNAANAQYLGGFFCWNSVESLVFSPTVELSSLIGFGTSIMAEYNRIESLIADRQKADFLGSISHELRSPLHGILAATEFLHKTELSPHQVTLMETIDACGRTLLDTMNQVLDFSKIMSNEKQFRRSKNRKKRLSQDDKKSLHRSASHLDKHIPTDVSILAEEVIEGLCLGHFHSQLTTTSGSLRRDSDAESTTRDSTPPVDVDIDISSNNWIYHTAPGALRRIIMNIVSNALKYTSEGRITIKLDAKESSETTDTDIVTLTVTDTGKGISEEFLRSGIFTPFLQEDSLVSGSGLGLSIVRSLIRSLGGTINIQSQLGKGTIVKVMLSLARPESENCDGMLGPASFCSSNERGVVSNDFRTTEMTLSGLNIAILDVEPEEAPSNPTWKDLSRYLTDGYGMNLVSASSDTPLDVIMAEKMPSKPDINKNITTNPAVIVFTKGWISNRSMEVKSPFGNKFVNIINRPCGPHKLRRSIQKSLKQPPPQSFTKALTTLPERTRQQISNDERTINITPPSPPPSETDSLRSNQSSKREARILVVEDNKINLNLMLAFLNKRKPSILDSAENGQLAVSAVEEEQTGYDIIFMDISMPIMTGIEATRAIRAIERKRSGDRKPATIIALTGLSSPSDRSEALESGMDMFLTKPVAFKNIKNILDGWVESGLESQSESAVDSE
ncbi:hypothetical protein N7495_002743 [Penicillium taxi]|uniref:uncharacterized protein n=1 Tax=Penicillium taxi TaxID=168475 RepID=UPI0025451D0F|nr:uncharacterized protein N7495_002743 [Penicillium taxi]KAJ5902215.1 hypothetical protein N7495_002743 [Penicillium taxi]